MRKPACCIYENKDADQLRSNCADDQRLCLRCTDSKSLYYQPSSVAAQPGLCRTWSETPKTGFLTTRLILSSHTIRRLDEYHQSKYANQKFFELTRNTFTFLRGSM